MEHHAMTAAETVKALGTDAKNGLDEREARARLLSHGRNRIEERKRHSLLRRFFEQFDDLMIIILLAAAAVSYITSLMSGEPDVTEPLIILAIVTLNALLGVIQEARAERSLDALKKLSSPHTLVIRGGREERIDSEEIVPGDIIRLRAGDKVSADCRLISSESLTADESPLTGEAHPVVKDADIVLDSLTAVGDMKNMLHASTHILSGTAEAVAVRTGMDTEVGKIASMLLATEHTETPLQKRLAATSKTLCVTALFICGIIFVIGMIKHIPPFEMFMTSVSLAVAAIPEGLPAIVTIVLALGVMRMSSRNAIVRSLPSVETLGCATVICTDKTGTLTQNRMSVHDMRTRDDRLLLELCSVCSESGEYINPTDAALADAAKKRGIHSDALKTLYPRISTAPFDPVRKRMSVLCRHSGGVRTVSKGAVEYILPLCGRYWTGTKAVPLTKELKRKIISDNSAMAENALRVIACAFRDDSSGSDIREYDMIYAGMAGIADPPRPEAAKAVKTCRRAGIRTVMITGDHAETALAIARMTGIAESGERAVTGAELDRADDEKLRELVKDHNVFSRVTPEHKSRIVRAMKANGEVTAMTGDGVNDAPALSQADIGCSMGITGTDVAKSASDLILTDDNFATIVSAVREGRAIFDNIRKTVKFLLSSNIGEILTVLFGLIFGCAAPLTAIELLWVNLVTDSFPAIALGLDPADKDIMERKPLDPKKGIFSAGLWASIAFEGLMIGALAVLARSIGMTLTGDETTARTMSFFVLSVSQLFHAFNMRSEHSILHSGIFGNKYLVAALILGVIAQTAIISLPVTARIFNAAPLGAPCLSISLALSFMPIIIVELQKAVISRHS